MTGLGDLIRTARDIRYKDTLVILIGEGSE